MYYIVLGEFAGLFYSPVNWESFNISKLVNVLNKLQMYLMTKPFVAFYFLCTQW